MGSDRSFYDLIKDLRALMTDLHAQYVHLRASLVAFSVFCLFTTIFSVRAIRLTIKGISEFDFSVDTAKLPYSLIFAILLFCFFRYIVRPSVKRFKLIYKQALETCNKIVDTNDWTTLRKRDISDNKRTQAVEIVDKFYCLIDLRYFPAKTKKSLFVRIMICTMFLQFIIMASILIMFVIYLIRLF